MDVKFHPHYTLKGKVYLISLMETASLMGDTELHFTIIIWMRNELQLSVLPGGASFTNAD